MLRTFGALAALVAWPVAGALTMTYPASTTVVHQASDWEGAELRGLVRGHSLRLAPGANTGTLTSPVLTLPPFDEVVPSWNVSTAAGGSAGLEVRVKLASGWSKWYSFGRWTAAQGRTSAGAQQDAAGRVLTDTLRLSAKASALQYRLTLTGGAEGHLVALSAGDRSGYLRAAGARGGAAWGRVLPVPQRSQMLYPGGGEVWCSPTSVSMILAHYGHQVTVPEAAAATYDKLYAGTGNWAFNAAFAGERGFRAYVTRLPNLAAAESYLERGIPLAVSLGWKRGELRGAPLSYSDGHLMVLVGFDAAGHPVLNDPAAPTDAGVRRTYDRAQFERLWLSHSGGVAYVVTPREPGN
ncbi:peptidase C39 family protein [Deinococcus lacus]|uniref:Peptidase C39 family protein n=1 Tax=Deinococcus lacus TaxID=392561 RepID=A0ABW1YDW7_9DEIO